MKRWLVVGILAGLSGLPSCTRHTVRLEPIEIKPIHITMDINIKVDREVDAFFDAVEKKAAEKDKTK